MVNERYSIAMAETLHYLKGISEEDLNKIPNKFMEFLKLNSSKDYNCDFDYTKPLNELKLKDETRGLIAMICLNYWCEKKKQKNIFIEHLNENENRYQEELRKIYNIDDIFNQKNSITTNEFIDKNVEENKLPIQSKKENIFKRFFKHIFNCII